MEYVQERVTTLHAFEDPAPRAPLDRTAVVVPMTEREYGGPAAERVFATLAELAPATVVVPLRAPASLVPEIERWLDGFDLPLEPVWCNGPALERALAEADLGGVRGKGHDVWLALGLAADAAEFVAVHDADATSYRRRHVPRLVAPLADGYDFVKGYYARVEDGRLYGRLFRLFVVPLLRALSERHDAAVLAYLSAFRYALAGEFAATAGLARSLTVPRRWGLEVATLGDAFERAGFAGSAQVDLGRHRHAHRNVDGESGLADMSERVGAALLRVVEEHGVAPDYGTLADRYREWGRRLVRQYAADASFNGLAYDRAAELEQVATYAPAVRPPAGPPELPPWTDAPLEPPQVRRAAREDLS